MARKSAPPATFPGSFHVLAGRHNPYCNRPRHGRDGTRARPAEALPVDRDGARPRDARALERCWSFVQRVAPTVRRHDRATWYPESPHEPDPSPHPSLPRPRPSGRRPPPVTRTQRRPRRAPLPKTRNARRRREAPWKPRAPRARPPRLGIGAGRGALLVQTARERRARASGGYKSYTGAHRHRGPAPPRARPSPPPAARRGGVHAALLEVAQAADRDGVGRVAAHGEPVLALGAVEVALDVLQQEPEVRVRDRVLGRDGDRRAVRGLGRGVVAPHALEDEAEVVVRGRVHRVAAQHLERGEGGLSFIPDPARARARVASQHRAVLALGAVDVAAHALRARRERRRGGSDDDARGARARARGRRALQPGRPASRARGCSARPRWSRPSARRPRSTRARPPSRRRRSPPTRSGRAGATRAPRAARAAGARTRRPS